MNGETPFRLGIVAGEESGDLLAADLVAALRARAGRPVELVGVGGKHLEAQGLASRFDSSEIALMGFTAVVARLPTLLRRIGETARALAEARPDCVVLVDIPDFNLRVAKKLRALAPTLPIIQYVCPSVWAWRPGRAPAMRGSVDRILCLLPFEVDELKRLGGPPGTYVGHRLVHDPGMLAARAAQSTRQKRRGERPTLLLLPGSRRSEVEGLIDAFGETLAIMKGQGHSPRLVLPTVPKVADLVRSKVAGWADKPEIVVGQEEKWRAFGAADAALAASGTVSLELALAGVPHVSCYKLDMIARLAFSMIPVWSGSLPNLIAGYPIVPEYFDRFVRPAFLARLLPRLMEETPARAAQLAGFADVAGKMATDRPAGDIAAEAVMKVTESKGSRAVEQ